MTEHTNTRKQTNIDKQRNNSNNNNNNNDNDRHHPIAQQYGTQTTIIPTPNPANITQLAGGKGLNYGFQPWTTRCAVAVLKKKKKTYSQLTFFNFLFKKNRQGTPKQKGVVFFLRLNKSTICLLTWINHLAAENTLVQFQVVWYFLESSVAKSHH